MTEPEGTRPCHERTLVVPASHPALPGHFPGAPVVPGVVLLDFVLRFAEDWLGRPLRVAAIPQCKFLAPLLPERAALVRLELDGERLRFDLSEAGQPMARGELVLSSEHAT